MWWLGNASLICCTSIAKSSRPLASALSRVHRNARGTLRLRFGSPYVKYGKLKIGSENRKLPETRLLKSETHIHTGGSIRFDEHWRRMEQKEGGPVDYRAVFKATHKSRKTNDMVTPSARGLLDAYNERMTQKYGEDLSSQPPGDNSVWEEVTGTTRGGYLRGLGIAAQISKKIGGYSDTSSASTSSAASELTLDSIRGLIAEQLALVLQTLQTMMQSRTPWAQGTSTSSSNVRNGDDNSDHT